jgi:hypothetical protein
MGSHQQIVEPLGEVTAKLKLLHLPQVLNVIRAQKLSGKLTAVSQPNKQATLTFKKGSVIDGKVWMGSGSGSGEEIVGDEALYILLNWKEGELDWQKNSYNNNNNNNDNNNTTTAITITIDSAQEADFYSALKQLTLRRFFATGLLNDPVISRFLESSEQANDEDQEDEDQDQDQEAVASRACGSVLRPRSAVISEITPVPHFQNNKAQGLPIPVGKPFNLIPPTNTLTELFERLQTAQFNGYLQLQLQLYRDFESRVRVVVTFENGAPSACYSVRQGHEEEEKERRGLAAWQSFKALEKLPLPSSSYQLMIVPDNILLAYRSLLGSYRPYCDLPATHANYRGLLVTFKKGRYNGVLHFKLPSAGVELYELIHDGEGIGTYNVEPNGYYLRTATGSIAMLLGNSQVKIDVYVTHDELISSAKVVNRLSAEEAAILGATLAASYRVLNRLLSEHSARERLYSVSWQLAKQAPFLGGLSKLQLPMTLQEQEQMLVQWVVTTNLQNTTCPRNQIIQAFEELFETYLQPLYIQLGSDTLHEMIVRALGKDSAEALRQIGVRLKFFDKGKAKLPEHKVTSSSPVEDNPYAF